MKRIPASKEDTTDIILANLAAGKGIKPELGDAYIQQHISRDVQTRFNVKPIEGSLPSDFDGIAPSELPLWCYVLAEGQEYGQRQPEHCVPCGEYRGILGPVASLIVAETFCSAISKASISVFNNQQYDYARAPYKLGAFWEKLLEFDPTASHAKKRLITTRQLVDYLNEGNESE